MTKYVVDPVLLKSFENTPVMQVTNMYKRSQIPIQIDNGHVSQILSKEKDSTSVAN